MPNTESSNKLNSKLVRKRKKKYLNILLNTKNKVQILVSVFYPTNTSIISLPTFIKHHE